MMEGSNRTFIGAPIAGGLFWLNRVLHGDFKEKQTIYNNVELPSLNEKLTVAQHTFNTSEQAFFDKVQEVYTRVHTEVPNPSRDQLMEFYQQGINRQTDIDFSFNFFGRKYGLINSTVSGNGNGTASYEELSATLPGYFEKVREAQKDVFGADFSNAPGGDKPMDQLALTVKKDRDIVTGVQDTIQDGQTALDDLHFNADLAEWGSYVVGAIALIGVVTFLAGVAQNVRRGY